MHYERQPSWVHRTVCGDVMLLRGGEARTLQGLAAVVWIVLDEPATVDDVVTRIRDLSPDLPIDAAMVLEALGLLVEHDAIATVGTLMRP